MMRARAFLFPSQKWFFKVFSPHFQSPKIDREREREKHARAQNHATKNVEQRGNRAGGGEEEEEEEEGYISFAVEEKRASSDDQQEHRGDGQRRRYD